MLQFSVQNTQLLDGFEAFNAGDWATVEELFCSDFTEGGKKFPAWHPMDGTAAKRGRQAVMAHLKSLWDAGTRAQLLGSASHGASLITLDYTSGGAEPPHACADKIVFTESGCIKEVWHCATGTHNLGGHPGHKAPHKHP